MNEIKPNVFGKEPDNYTKPSGELEAELEMQRRTEEQLRLREEKNAPDKMAESNVKNQPTLEVKPNNVVDTKGVYSTEDKFKLEIERLSQPQMNQAFDVIPLPSEGKLYPSKKKSIKVAYLTTADENILTSPNLVQSGQFLEILMNRKILEPGLRYQDLHTGDRNAIMIWLRATGYGTDYGVRVLDENNEPFDTTVDLSDLKTIKLGAEPDDEGLFDFKLPLSGDNIKFKLLTTLDVDIIEQLVEADNSKEFKMNNESIYILERQIVEVNGERGSDVISSYVKNIRTLDVQKLRKYVSEIESGIDLNITIQTPGGGSVTTFLPINPSFFWPE